MASLFGWSILSLVLVASCAGGRKPRESSAGAPAAAEITDGRGTGGAPAAGTGGADPGRPGTGGSTATTGGAPGACAGDADCRLFADMCTGCDCRALARGESDPTCAGPGVRCLVDPCIKKHAACQKGRCTVASGPGYDPCAGKRCGDSCKICPPTDTTCMETMEVKQCNADGKCSALPPGCGGK